MNQDSNKKSVIQFST